MKKRVFWNQFARLWLVCVPAHFSAPTDARVSNALRTAQETRGPASAQAARKLRLFKHSEIAARAVDDARPEAR